jgi:hypothetical protein
MTGTQEQKRQDETKHYNDSASVTRKYSVAVDAALLRTTRLRQSQLNRQRRYGSFLGG